MLPPLLWNDRERVDLHLHSHYSDGLHSPSVLVKMAAARGIRLLALTDHATLAGLPEAILAGVEQGVYVLPGLELNGSRWDFLGLLPDEGHDGLLRFLERVNHLRRQRMEAILERTNHHLGTLAWEELAAFAAPALPSRPHLARLLVERGFFPSLEAVFQKFLRRGSPGYCPALAPSDQECIGAITGAGGLALLAHPHWTIAQEHFPLHPELNRLRDWGVVGYEGLLPAVVGKSRHDEWQQASRQLGWLELQGSNFHGEGITAATLGEKSMGADRLARLLERLPATALHAAWCKRLAWRAANLSREELLSSLTPHEVHLDQLQRRDLLTLDPRFPPLPPGYRGDPFVLLGPGALEQEELVSDLLAHHGLERLDRATIDDYPQLAWCLYRLFTLPEERKLDELFKFSLDHHLFGEKAQKAKVIFFRPRSDAILSLRQLKQSLRHALGTMRFYRIRWADRCAINFTAHIHIPEEADVAAESWKLTHLLRTTEKIGAALTNDKEVP